MPADEPQVSAIRRPTVFLSYASEDRRAAQLIRDALPGFGMEVWYDESDLVGGDAWDQKIRRQIRECDYFMPVISAHTEARHEGYFRREWRLAVERTLDMADDHVFLLPIVIDRTVEAGARVPERFRAVQWLKVPDGQPNAALEGLCRRLVSGEATKPATPAPTAAKPVASRGPEPPSSGGTPPRRGGEFPDFPREEPGQRIRFWFQVVGWALHSAWVAFSRFPKWARIGVYCWVAILLLSRGCTSSHDRLHDRDTADTPRISAAQVAKLRQLSESHPGNWTPADVAQLATQIAKDVPGDSGDDSPTDTPVLAIPFLAPAADAAAQKLAGSVFTQLYGRLAILRHGHVALAGQPLPAFDASAALTQGRARGSRYIVYGAVAGSAPDQQLTVKILEVDDGSVVWSKSYPVTGADPVGIATEVSARVPRSDD